MPLWHKGMAKTCPAHRPIGESLGSSRMDGFSHPDLVLTVQSMPQSSEGVRMLYGCESLPRQGLMKSWSLGTNGLEPPHTSAVVFLCSLGRVCESLGNSNRNNIHFEGHLRGFTSSLLKTAIAL